MTVNADSEEVVSRSIAVEDTETSSAGNSPWTEPQTSALLSPVREESEHSASASFGLNDEQEKSTSVVPDTPDPQLGPGALPGHEKDSPGQQTLNKTSSLSPSVWRVI